MTALLSMTALSGVFAASTSPTSSQSSFHKGRRNSGEMRALTPEEKTVQETEFAQDLATALGTSKERVLADFAAHKTVEDIVKASGQDAGAVFTKLKLAHDAEMKARVALEVASGKMTQAQADKMNTAMTARKGMRGFSGKDSHTVKMLGDMASILNIPAATIKAEIVAGKKPLDIVAASGMPQADFETKMKALRMAEMKSKLEAEVSAGKITQADADTKLAKMAAHKEGMRGMKSAVRTIKSAFGVN